jgi:hypothetical protein
LKSRVAITILRPREQVEHYWRDPEYRPEHIQSLGASVIFGGPPAVKPASAQREPAAAST